MSSPSGWTPLWPAMTRVLVIMNDLANMQDSEPMPDSLAFAVEGSVAQGLVAGYALTLVLCAVLAAYAYTKAQRGAPVDLILRLHAWPLLACFALSVCGLVGAVALSSAVSALSTASDLQQSYFVGLAQTATNTCGWGAGCCAVVKKHRSPAAPPS